MGNIEFRYKHVEKRYKHTEKNEDKNLSTESEGTPTFIDQNKKDTEKNGQ